MLHYASQGINVQWGTGAFRAECLFSALPSPAITSQPHHKIGGSRFYIPTLELCRTVGRVRCAFFWLEEVLVVAPWGKDRWGLELLPCSLLPSWPPPVPGPFCFPTWLSPSSFGFPRCLVPPGGEVSVSTLRVFMVIYCYLKHHFDFHSLLLSLVAPCHGR